MSERLQTVIDWIPVGERLPEMHHYDSSKRMCWSELVLIALPNGTTRESTLERVGAYPPRWALRGPYSVALQDVAHWAPMPTFAPAQGGV